MSTINGCETVNCGTIEFLADSKHSYYVELIGPGYSTHATNAAVTYFMDNHKKIGMTLYADEKTKEAYVDLQYFKNPKDLQPYYTSRAYTLFNLPEKYVIHAGELVRAYSIYFNNARMAFNYPKSWGAI